MNIVLGVTGSISAYKSAELARSLTKKGHNVDVILTKSAEKFITKLSFEVLTGNPVYTDMWQSRSDTKHISLAKKADIFVIAPATANIIGKIANGIADDMLSTCIMATKAPILIAPAMNTAMYENKILQKNIKSLDFVDFIAPTSGLLACGDVGDGKLADVSDIENEILRIAYKKDMLGINILITSGATKENIDPVRFITNYSTGKMGMAIANDAYMRGANVTFITSSDIKTPANMKRIQVSSADDMFNKVMENVENMDIIIKTAAVSDYKSSEIKIHKIKKNDNNNLILKLEKNKDILKEIGKIKHNNQFLCGFSMETENLLENSENKLISKNLDMIVANDLSKDGVGFGFETNKVTIISKKSPILETEKLEKSKIATIILDKILEIR